MKKTYIIPGERVIDLGLEEQLLDVSGNAPTDGLDGSGDGQGDGETMGVRAQYNRWSNEW